MEAHDETVYSQGEPKARCRDCGRIFSTGYEWEDFVRAQVAAGDYSHGSYEVIYDQIPTSVHYDAITAEVWIEDSPAYTEEVKQY